MIKRYAYDRCIELLKSFPILTITGPRQSGKTTLSKQLFPHKPYFNLEEIDIRQFATDDPRGFLRNMPDGGIIDEIQRVPELTSYLQSVVDNSNLNGQFILTGSQNLEVTKTVNQSLAGRSIGVKLLPFHLQELIESGYNSDNVDDQIFKGFYPRLYSGSNSQTVPFYMSYYENYVERDIRGLMQIENMILFDKFVRLIAARTGQLLNLSAIANDTGLSQPTIKHWVSALEAGFIIFRLAPYFPNISKRLIKTPKVYFYDTGLLCFLLGITEPVHLVNHPLRGAIFENMVVADILKQRHHSVLPSNLYFYRDHSGIEVDLLMDNGGQVTPIEIKSSATWNKDFQKGIKALGNIIDNTKKPGYVVYNGIDIPMDDYEVISWKNCNKIR